MTRPSVYKILLGILAGAIGAVGVISLALGFSNSIEVRLLQGLTIFGLGLIIVGGAVVLALVRLGDWHEPESEEEFELCVRRAEELAANDPLHQLNAPADYDEFDFAFDTSEAEEFDAIVRAAVDDLPLEFHRALEHVAIVVSDGGPRGRMTRGRPATYASHQTDTVAHEHFHDRIIIYRDTLLRDFGHDRELLLAQVTRTLRYELSHHLGWDESGVRGREL